MEDIIRFETVGKYSAYNNSETLHPLVNVIDLSKASKRRHMRMHIGLYMVILKQLNCGNIRYGCNYYDYQEGTLVFLAPGQVIGFDNEEGFDDQELYQPQGYVLVFHPDLIKGTNLGHHFHNYTFFSYQVNEALHLSQMERSIIFDCFTKIQTELKHTIDKHTKTLIISSIELLLNYCTRYYDRQFITREVANKGILERFEKLLNDYFNSDKPQLIGLPSVAYCAEELNLSANYFGDLIKKDTGISAHEYIQSKVIDIAKEKIFDTTKSVSQIAYELGFKYPPHFTRVFKQMVGYTPNEYRLLN